jgi:hypothetical protein
MLSTLLRSSVHHGSLRKTSKLSYSVWRSVASSQQTGGGADFVSKHHPEIIRVHINFQCGPHINGLHASSRRLLSTSATRWREPSSKVEETVDRLKEKQQSATLSQQDEQVVKTEHVHIAPEPPDKKDASSAVTKKSLWVRVKDEVRHYYSGFKLLFLDVRVSSKIVWKILRGKTLTRRESRQLVRTTSVIIRKNVSTIFSAHWNCSTRGCAM